MKYFLSIIFFLFLITLSFAKGASGTYYIKGIAYGHDKLILKNMELTVDFGFFTKKVYTNDNGQFEIEVTWTYGCRSVNDRKSAKQQTKMHNPKFLNIRCEDKELRIKNKWRKYSYVWLISPNKSKEQMTMKKNFHFP